MPHNLLRCQLYYDTHRTIWICYYVKPIGRRTTKKRERKKYNLRLVNQCCHIPNEAMRNRKREHVPSQSIIANKCLCRVELCIELLNLIINHILTIVGKNENDKRHWHREKNGHKNEKIYDGSDKTCNWIEKILKLLQANAVYVK